METRECKVCHEVKPLDAFHKNGEWGGKPLYRRDCKACRLPLQKVLDRRRRPRKRYPGEAIKKRPENCTWATVGSDVLRDYVYVTQAWGWDHAKALIWIARGYGIPWNMITQWPVQETAEGMKWQP